MLSHAWGVSDPAQPDRLDQPLERAAVSIPAFAEIYERYFDFVWSCARRMGVGVESLDDVVQNVFIVIHAKLPTLEQPESLRSWIYGIVRRTVSGYRRSLRTEQQTEVSFAVIGPLSDPTQPSPHELAEQGDRLALLASLLAGLDDAKREVFVLTELDEMTAPEIARALEIPLNTVYSRLRAARQYFEQALARHLARDATRGRR